MEPRENACSRICNVLCYVLLQFDRSHYQMRQTRSILFEVEKCQGNTVSKNKRQKQTNKHDAMAKKLT